MQVNDSTDHLCGKGNGYVVEQALLETNDADADGNSFCHLHAFARAYRSDQMRNDVMGLKQFLKNHQAVTQVRQVEIDGIGKVGIRRPSIAELERIAQLSGVEQMWEMVRTCVIDPKLSDEDKGLFLGAGVEVSDTLAQLVDEINRFALGEPGKG